MTDRLYKRNPMAFPVASIPAKNMSLSITWGIGKLVSFFVRNAIGDFRIKIFIDDHHLCLNQRLGPAQTRARPSPTTPLKWAVLQAEYKVRQGRGAKMCSASSFRLDSLHLSKKIQLVLAPLVPPPLSVLRTPCMLYCPMILVT